MLAGFLQVYQCVSIELLVAQIGITKLNLLNGDMAILIKIKFLIKKVLS